MVDDEAVLVLPEQGQVKVLNPVGASIWALADGSRTVREIAAALCAEYAVERAEAEADALAFVSRLEAKGILAARDGGIDGARAKWQIHHASYPLVVVRGVGRVGLGVLCGGGPRECDLALLSGHPG